MVTRDTAWAPGTPCWVDLGVTDIPKAKAFYSALFGWEIQDGPPEAGGYSMCEIGGQHVAGIGSSQGDMPIFWTTYLASADADKTAEAIKAAGGQVLMEPFDVMDAGRMFMASRSRRRDVRRLAGQGPHWRATRERAGLAHLEREHEPRL